MRILVIDDRVPHLTLGQGYPRANAMLRELVRRDHDVAFYPLVFPNEASRHAYADIPREVTLLVNRGTDALAATLAEIGSRFDAVIVSRPPNMRTFRAALAASPELRERLCLVYDAEALFAHRYALKAALCEPGTIPDDVAAMLQEELALTGQADILVSVTEAERRVFADASGKPTFVVGVPLERREFGGDFETRTDLLFVGSVRPDSPNEDSLLWFLAEAFREIHARTGARLLVAGGVDSAAVAQYASSSVLFCGMVPDLAPLFARSRIFVAPTRYAAGVPQKVVEAAAYGLPVVTTPLISEQLGWGDAEGIAIGGDGAAFARETIALYTDPLRWNRARANVKANAERVLAARPFERGIDGLVDEMERVVARRARGVFA